MKITIAGVEQDGMVRSVELDIDLDVPSVTMTPLDQEGETVVLRGLEAAPVMRAGIGFFEVCMAAMTAHETELPQEGTG